MKHYLILFLVFILACKDGNTVSPVQSTKKTEVNNALPYKHKINIDENINNTQVKIDIEYTLDSIRYKINNFFVIKPINIDVKISPKNLFPDGFIHTLKETIDAQELYSLESFTKRTLWEHKKFKLLKADFNFDGYTDIYFVNKFGKAQNTGYEIYLFDKDKNNFVKAADSSKAYWSRIDFLPDTKTIKLYNHMSQSEVSFQEYKVLDNGVFQLLK